MITDIQATLSDEQALTATAASTNTFDAGANYDWSRGEPMCVLFTVVTAASTNDGNETYSFGVQTDDNSSFSSAVTLGTKAVAGSLLTAGAQVVVPFAEGAEQYTRAQYTLGGTTPSITVTAEVKPLCDVQSQTTDLPSGYSVTI